MTDTDAFQRFSANRTREATTASIERLSTTFDQSDDFGLLGIGNAWSRLHYGSEFGLVRPGRNEIAVSLVFVQTKNGNTGGPNPSAFGGGATDKHLIYEGLSRVSADAVLAGAGSVHRGAFFSVWHPELVALRTSLGLQRHPAQVVVSKRGRVDIDALLFNVPDVPVFLIAGDECLARHEPALRARPWVRLVPVNGDGLRPAVERLRDEGIQRVSAIGGRFTATHLVDAGLIRDIYLTTTSLDGGELDTPWYCGTNPPQLTAITSKQWRESGSRVFFEHCLITSHRESSWDTRSRDQRAHSLSARLRRPSWELLRCVHDAVSAHDSSQSDTLAVAMEKPKVLTAKELRTIMPRLSGWKLAQNKLSRTFEFHDFVQSLSFVNSLVVYFETVDHHPDVRIAYGEVTFELTRYDLGGKVTDRDVEVAKKISSLYRARS